MSLSQSNIKFISSLKQKKFRQSYHKFTVEGDKIVKELLRQNRYRVVHVMAQEAWFDQNSAFHQFDFSFDEPMNLDSPKRLAGAKPISAAKLSTENASSEPLIPATIVSEKELQRISQLSTPNQVVALVHLPDDKNDDLPLLSTSWSLFLDGIQSPANLGAILRVADWFGFDHVFGGPGTVDLYNQKSIQASMGAFLRVNYRNRKLEEILAVEPGLSVFAADLQGEDAFRFQPPPGGLLVIGNEGGGIQASTRKLVTQYLRIPKAPERETESLNAAVATGILCGLLRNG